MEPGKGENLHRLVFRAIYREKPEKGLRARDWKELSDAEVEAEVDRRFGTRQSRKRKSLQRELLKWVASCEERRYTGLWGGQGVERSEEGEGGDRLGGGRGT